MTIDYDKETDTLTIILGPQNRMRHEVTAGGWTAGTDGSDELLFVSIENASRFIARALAAGVEVEGAPKVAEPPGAPVWHGADSSMISAFSYDEAKGILEVAFHRSGVYRYHDVPRHVFEGLRDADSKGSYMRAMIIDRYPAERKGR